MSTEAVLLRVLANRIDEVAQIESFEMPYGPAFTATFNAIAVEGMVAYRTLCVAFGTYLEEHYSAVLESILVQKKTEIAALRIEISRLARGE